MFNLHFASVACIVLWMQLALIICLLCLSLSCLFQRKQSLQVIIMLPDRINLIFLSATTPNTVEFSDWIGRTKRRQVFVTSTNKRPVPLQHFLLHNDEVYKLMHAEGGYNPAGLAAAAKHEKDRGKPKPMSAENAKMAADRSAEKAAMAAQFAGKGGGGGGGGGGRGGGGGGGKGGGGRGGGGGGGGGGGPPAKPVAKNTGAAAGPKGVPNGTKAQWISLLHLLRNGGREEV